MPRAAILMATLGLTLALASACGGKDTPPASNADAKPPEATAPPVTSAPPETEAPGPDATEPSGDVEAAPSGEDVGASAKAADEAWQAALAKGGCLGVSARGDTAWFVTVTVRDGDTERELHRVSLDRDDPGDATSLEAAEGEALVAEVRGILGDDAAGLRPGRALGQDRVTVADAEVTLGSGGGETVTVYAHSADPDQESSGAKLRVVAACEAAEDGNAFLVIEERLVRVDDNDAEIVDPPTLWPVAVDTWERGTAPCMPIPTGVAKAEEPAKATVESMTAAAADNGCVAMAADGSYALFHTLREEGVPFDDVEDTDEHDIEVLAGAGVEAPEIDASCVIEGCGAAAKKALEARIAALDLRQCPPIADVIVGDRHLPVVTRGDFALEVDGRPRTIVALTMGGQDGEDHETLKSVHQHPKGGPVFVQIENWDTGLHELRVAVVGLAEMGFCAPKGGTEDGAKPEDGAKSEDKGAMAAPPCADDQRLELDLAALRTALRAGDAAAKYGELLASLEVDATEARCDLETLDGHLEGGDVANTVALVTCASPMVGQSQSFAVLRAEEPAPTKRWCVIHAGATAGPWAREAPGEPLKPNAPPLDEADPDASTACWSRAPTRFRMRLTPLVAPDRQALIVDARFGRCGGGLVSSDEVTRHVFAVEDGKLVRLYQAPLETTAYCRGLEPLEGESAEIEPVGGFPRGLWVARTRWCSPSGYAADTAKCQALLAAHEGYTEEGPGIMPPAPWELPKAGREGCSDTTEVSWLRYDRGLYVKADGPPPVAAATAGTLPTTPWIDGSRSGARPDTTPYAASAELPAGCVAESATLGTVLCVLQQRAGTPPQPQKRLVVLGVDGAVRTSPATAEALKAELERGAYTALSGDAETISATDFEAWTEAERFPVSLRPPNDSEAAFDAKGYEHPDAVTVFCGADGDLRLYRASGGGKLRVRRPLAAELGFAPLLIESSPTSSSGYAALVAPRICALLVQSGGVVAIDRPAPTHLSATDHLAAGRKATTAGHYVAAIRHLDAALREDPTLAPALSGRGYARLQAGHLFAARADLKRALTMSDDERFRGAVEHNLTAVAEKLGGL